MGVKEQVADGDVAGFEYLLCARHATTDFTPLPHSIYKVNPILPYRKSEAGGSRGNGAVIAVGFLQTTLHMFASSPLPGPSRIPEGPATQDTDDG